MYIYLFNIYAITTWQLLCTRVFIFFYKSSISQSPSSSSLAGPLLKSKLLLEDLPWLKFPTEIKQVAIAYESFTLWKIKEKRQITRRLIQRTTLLKSLIVAEYRAFSFSKKENKRICSEAAKMKISTKGLNLNSFVNFPE